MPSVAVSKVEGVEAVDPTPGVLTLGLVAGGVQASRGWEHAVRSAALRVMEICQSFESPVHVTVVFYIPGEVYRPDFNGLRTGRSSERGRSLTVQVALTESSIDDANREIRDWLAQAVDVAEDFARRRGIENLPGLRDLLDAL